MKMSGLSLILVFVTMILAADAKGYRDDYGSMKYVDAICSSTTYKDLCEMSIQYVKNNSSASLNDYIKAIVETALSEMKKSFESTKKTNVNNDTDHYNYMALEGCKFFLDKAIDTLENSLNVLNSNTENIVKEARNFLSWMAGTYTLQINCIDQIKNPKLKSTLNNILVNSTKVAHNAVHIFSNISDIYKLYNDGFPIWFGEDKRRQLSMDAYVSEADSKPDVVVGEALDLTKIHVITTKTIKDAIAAYNPTNRNFWWIHVPAGVYEEPQLLINKTQKNIYMTGDGIGRTIITGAVCGNPTVNTSTFTTAGDGFMAKNITFRNEAGPEGMQAVAFTSLADQTAVFNCSFEGFQDTLYYQSFRQFYHNCYIYGTIDFIFGMGTTVIQNSTIVVRKPLPGQYNVVMADGRSFENLTIGGVVLHNCKIIPDENLYNQRFHFPTYLGRPWKNASLTVVMHSELSDFIRAEGYAIWEGNNNHLTASYYEYNNHGPGAKIDLRNRQFKHFRLLTPLEAYLFTPGQFIEGKYWIPNTNFPNYNLDR